MNRTITRLSAVTGACVLALVVPVAGIATAAPEPVAAPAAAQMRSDVNEDAGRVEQWAHERFPDLYAGLATFDTKLLVFRKPSAEFDTELGRLELSTPVELRDAPYSNRELEVLANRVVGDIGYWQTQGVEIMSVGARNDGTAVEVGTPQADKLGPLLPGRYGVTPPAVAESVGPVAPAG